MRTTTAGYDPSANGVAEQAVGHIKRKARQLLIGARLPSSWWGTAVLAAGDYSRCGGEFKKFPTIPYGTRVMVVEDPPTQDAFMPRSMPATVFGPSATVPGGYLIYQRGKLRDVVNVQTAPRTWSM